MLRVISSAGGELGNGADRQIVDRTLLTTRSIEYDAIVLADGLSRLRDVKLTVLLHEAFRLRKPIGGRATPVTPFKTPGSTRLPPASCSVTRSTRPSRPP